MRRLLLTLAVPIGIATISITAQATHKVDRARPHNGNQIVPSSSPASSAKDEETRRENDRALAAATSTSISSAKDEETRRENDRALASAASTLNTAQTRETVSATGTASTTTPSGGSGFGTLIVFGGLCFIGYKLVKSWGKQRSRAAVVTADESRGQLAVLDELRKGTKPTVYALNGFYPQKGESVIWAFDGVQHFHQGSHSEWVGRSGGLSVRVMKGVWYRSGRNHGHSEQHSSMDDQGVGMLVLTTKALCFVGVNSARLPFAHILALETFSDGIGLDTDYAKNTKHQFAGMNSDNVTFLKTAMDLVSAKAA